jgi:hypothetical protein
MFERRSSYGRLSLLVITIACGSDGGGPDRTDPSSLGDTCTAKAPHNGPQAITLVEMEVQGCSSELCVIEGEAEAGFCTCDCAAGCACPDGWQCSSFPGETGYCLPDTLIDRTHIPPY